MKTTFAPEQLNDPATATSEKAIRNCVHCGFCTATCPTYVLLGDERDSPRGRIYLIKDMLEKNATPTAEVVTHIDRCLSCLSCTTTCPSGVDYMHLIDHARLHVENTYQRPITDRLMRWALLTILPHRARFGAAIALGKLVSPLQGLFEKLGAKRIAALLRMARTSKASAAELASSKAMSARKGSVLLQSGCIEPVLRPEFQAATVRLLNRQGYDVARAPGETCCGALAHHLGQEDEALTMARRNVDAWSTSRDEAGAIVVTASGCGSMIKDYGFLLRNDPAYATRAASISALARDISEFVAMDSQPVTAATRKIRIAYHAACSLQHGQKITTHPRRLLEQAGFEVVTPVDAHLCCGSAGTYSILQPEIANRLGDRKAATLEALAPVAIAVGNIGCAQHIGMRTALPVVHIAELLDWAAGGPCPKALEQIESQKEMPRE
ncbi:MAG: glycolate oxidase subunit GlcF [Hyphomonadaceae bacterium]|nr:glycolate oxidase subunit GlcF [Hyphomonadaceae bacterium]